MYMKYHTEQAEMPRKTRLYMEYHTEQVGASSKLLLVGTFRDIKGFSTV